METADLLNINLTGSYLTLDSGFHSKDNDVSIKWNNLIPIIKPNVRNNKDPDKIEALFADFDEKIYKERYRIERTFAWQDTYRKLVIRYEKLKCTHLGFKHLAYSMINFRSFFNKNPWKPTMSSTL